MGNVARVKAGVVNRVVGRKVSVMAVARLGRSGASGADQGQHQPRQGDSDHVLVIRNFTLGHVHSPT